MKKNVFWGTGKIGHKIFDFWKQHNMKPDFFCDSSEKKWGDCVEGIRILSPSELLEIKDKVFIFITCNYYDEIKSFLLKNGVQECFIIRAEYIYSAEMLYHITDKLYYKTEKDVNKKRSEGCIIDLSGGMVLGGVERWSYSLAKVLKKNGIDGAYIIPPNIQSTILDDTYTTIRPNLKDEKDSLLDKYIDEIASSQYLTVICNFPFEIFNAACIVKKLFYPELQIIAVIHNDLDIYYDSFYRWNEYIDKCLVISKKMKRILVERGFPIEKIELLYWKIDCENKLVRRYNGQNEPLRIGYAGRLIKEQKRLDLLIDVAEELKRNGLKYIISMAGMGDYEETIKSEIKKRELGEFVKIVGCVNNNSISMFWKEQDICISCSDFEGHSISQSEAMAGGAVLVITDVSGAEDDVISGYNGYIAQPQNVNEIVEYIKYLYNHRELLETMGKRSHEIILKRNETFDINNYWRKLLYKI